MITDSISVVHRSTMSSTENIAQFVIPSGNNHTTVSISIHHPSAHHEPSKPYVALRHPHAPATTAVEILGSTPPLKHRQQGHRGRKYQHKRSAPTPLKPSPFTKEDHSGARRLCTDLGIPAEGANYDRLLQTCLQSRLLRIEHLEAWHQDVRTAATPQTGETPVC
jgi:hypothetical protein